MNLIKTRRRNKMENLFSNLPFLRFDLQICSVAIASSILRLREISVLRSSKLSWVAGPVFNKVGPTIALGDYNA
ncbi:hypothetical protein ACFX13_044124 [Malus domestica]